MNSRLWWYTARASGLVAWALLALSVLWGLAMSTRALGRHPRPAWLLDLHRFLAGAALTFVGIHVGSILLDNYVHFGLVDVLVPFAGSWHPVAVAWGIVAFYLMVAVEVTSLLRAHLSRRAWRATHYLSFPVFATATVHTLTAGTDRGSLTLQVAVYSVTAAIAALTIWRGRTEIAAARAAQPAQPGAAAQTASRRRALVTSA